MYTTALRAQVLHMSSVVHQRRREFIYFFQFSYEDEDKDERWARLKCGAHSLNEQGKVSVVLGVPYLFMTHHPKSGSISIIGPG